MNKLLNTLFALSVACATSLALAQAPAASAPAAAPAPAVAAAPVAKPASPKSLEAKTAMCYGCHKIAGQHADYLFVALKAYKTEGNPNVGRSNGVMGAIAKQFSNAELKVLAKYVSSLDGELQTVPETRFHHD